MKHRLPGCHGFLLLLVLPLFHWLFPAWDLAAWKGVKFYEKQNISFYFNYHVVCTMEHFSLTHECLGASVSGGRNFHFLLRCFYDFLRYFHYLGICQRTSTGFVDANLLCHQWALWNSGNWGILPDGDFIVPLMFDNLVPFFPSEGDLPFQYVHHYPN